MQLRKVCGVFQAWISSIIESKGWKAINCPDIRTYCPPATRCGEDTKMWSYILLQGHGTSDKEFWKCEPNWNQGWSRNNFLNSLKGTQIYSKKSIHRLETVNPFSQNVILRKTVRWDTALMLRWEGCLISKHGIQGNKEKATHLQKAIWVGKGKAWTKRSKGIWGFPC